MFTHRRLLTAAALLSPLVLYLAAVNPYHAPDVYDDITYYFGARSLAESCSFKLQGAYIADWGPGVSLLLAVPMVFGFTSVVVAKLVIVFTVLLGILAVYKFLREEQRPYPLLVTVLFAVNPVCFVQGTMIMKEWLFVATSFLFLAVLGSPNLQDKPVRRGLLLGALLGYASLTWWFGVLLGFAVVAEVVRKMRRCAQGGRISAVKSELIVAGIGATIFLAWRVKLALQSLGNGAVDSHYFSLDTLFSLIGDGLKEFSLAEQVNQFGGALFMFQQALGRFGVDTDFAIFACVVVIGLMLVGALSLFRRRGIRLADYYALAVVALLVLYYLKFLRYAIPILPLLLGYFIEGVMSLRNFATRAVFCPARILRALAALWLAWYVVLDGYLLLRSNASHTHAALFYPLSPTPERFYVGLWNDLYRVCKVMKEDPVAGNVAVIGGDDMYVYAFSGRSTLNPTFVDGCRYLLVESDAEAEVASKMQYRLVETARAGTIRLYRVNTTQVSPTN